MDDQTLFLLVPFAEKSKKFFEKELKRDIDETKIYKTINIIKKFVESKQITTKELFPEFYPIARILLSVANEQFLYNTFSNIYHTLIMQSKQLSVFELLELLNIPYDSTQDYYKIPFQYFVEAKITKPEDKLINNVLHQGLVWLNEEKARNFAARLVAKKVIEGLPFKENLNKFEKYKAIMKKIKKKENRIKIKNVQIKEDAFPPCMHEIVNELLSGGNPTHMARYYLATFLFGIGMEFEQIHNIFKNAANYDEKTTTYQLEKIKNYTAPSCETLKSMGFCRADDSCENIHHPLNYYFKKIRRENEKREKT